MAEKLTPVIKKNVQLNKLQPFIKKNVQQTAIFHQEKCFCTASVIAVLETLTLYQGYWYWGVTFSSRNTFGNYIFPKCNSQRSKYIFFVNFQTKIVLNLFK